MRIILTSIAAGLIACLGGAFGIYLADPGVDPSSFLSPRRLALLAGLLVVASGVMGVLLHHSGARSHAAGAHGDAGRVTAPAMRGWPVVIMGYVGFAAMTAVGVILADITGVDLVSRIELAVRPLAIGVVAALPPMALLGGIMAGPTAGIRRFREQQITMLETRGFDFTAAQILLISLGAGISEEILFRGALQGWLTEAAGLGVALIVPSILFGLVHGSSAAYVVITGVIGLYLAIVMAWSGNLVVPMTAHAVYDIFALFLTVRAIAARRAAGTVSGPPAP